MADQSVLRDKVRLYFETPGGDVTHASELYHDDVVPAVPNPLLRVYCQSTDRPRY